MPCEPVVADGIMVPLLRLLGLLLLLLSVSPMVTGTMSELRALHNSRRADEAALKTSDEAAAVPKPITLSLHDAILTIGHSSKGLFSSASQVQRGLFGVTAYEGGDLFADGNGSEWVERWGIDSVGFPLAVQDYNLPQPLLPNGSKAACPGPVHITEAELRRWWDPGNAAGATRAFHGRWPNNIYPWGNWLPHFGQAEPFAYLLSNTWGNGECNTNLDGPPRNSTLWGIAHGLSFRLARQSYPQLQFAHIGNEPNAGWFRQVPKQTGQAFATFFREAAMGIKSVVGNTASGGGPVFLGGAVMCWGPLDGYAELSQWGWLTALIDESLHVARSPANPTGTNALDFVDFHAYGNGEANAGRMEAEVHMVAAYAATQHHVHMPSAVTETSWKLDSWAEWLNHSAHFSKRTLPRLRQIFAGLAHPDKVMVLQEHDLGADAGGKFTVRGCAGGGVGECLCDTGTMGAVLPNGSRLCATPEMEMFRALRPLRGSRLDRSLVGVDDATQDVRFEACLNEQSEGGFGEVVLAAANFGAEPVPLALQIDASLAASLDVVLAPWSALLLDGVSLRPLPIPAETRTTAGNGAVLALTLPPESLLVLSMPLVKPHTVTATHSYTEVFASDVGVAIDNATVASTSLRQAATSVSIALPPEGNFSGVNPQLRFGIKGPAVSCKSWSISLNASTGDNSSDGRGGDAQEFKITWDATVEFRGGGCRSSPSSQINCSAIVRAGKGVGFAEVSLKGWALPPPVSASASASKLLPGVFLGGKAIRIDPWELASYEGDVNASRCAELCSVRSDWSDLGPSCVAFRLTNSTGEVLCTMLSSRLPSEDRPAKPGEVVTSGVALLRTVNVTMKASCQTPLNQPLSYLSFVALVVD